MTRPTDDAAAAVPRLLPRARPSRELVEAHRKAEAKQTGKAPSVAAMTAWLRSVALHEAAHAVVHLSCRHRVEFACINGTDTRSGHVCVRRRPWDDDANGMVRALLAGPVIDLVAAKDDATIDVTMGMEGGDVLAAVRTILTGTEHGPATIWTRFAELWDETAVLLTHPRIWRQIVAVADALIRHGRLDGGDIVQLIDPPNGRRRPDARPVPGLMDARLRVLAAGSSLYEEALDWALYRVASSELASDTSV